MNTANESVSGTENIGDDYDLAFEETVAPELSILKNWLPAATPTDGQPYSKTRELREHPPAPKPGRIRPRGIDAGSSDF